MMQMVEAEEEAISTRQETDCMLETAPVPRAGNEIRWKRMNTCDRGWREGEHWQKERSKNSQGKDPKTFEENSQGGDLSILEINSWGKDPRTFEGNSQERDPSTFEGRKPSGGKVASSRKMEGREVEEKEEKQNKN